MLKVNEVFGPTQQGEGKSIGMFCFFLRLTFCNLHCIWCDTPHTWDWRKFNKQKEIHKITFEKLCEIFKYFKNKYNLYSLVISGGEPLLQQKELLPFVEFLKKEDWRIEIETNGTIIPKQGFIKFIDQINCSPKLSNSKDLERKRIVPKTLQFLSQSKITNFKFVISKNEDVNEVLDLVDKFQLKEVYLMPQASSKKELLQRSLWLEKICNKYNFIFTTRLSITDSGIVRGV